MVESRNFPMIETSTLKGHLFLSKAWKREFLDILDDPNNESFHKLLGNTYNKVKQQLEDPITKKLDLSLTEIVRIKKMLDVYDKEALRGKHVNNKSERIFLGKNSISARDILESILKYGTKKSEGITNLYMNNIGKIEDITFYDNFDLLDYNSHEKKGVLGTYDGNVHITNKYKRGQDSMNEWKWARLEERGYGTVESTILHEITHGFIGKTNMKELDEWQTMNHIYNFCCNNIGDLRLGESKPGYFKKDLEEFVCEIAGNDELQLYLDNLKPLPSLSHHDDIYYIQDVKTILKSLGINKERTHNSLLSQILLILVKMITKCKVKNIYTGSFS